MRRLLSGVARLAAANRLLVTAALVGTVPFALAQQAGPAADGHIGGSFAGHIAGGYAGHAGGGNYGRSFSGYSAPNFVSTFGPHSITGTPGANFVAPSGRLAPDYASSWGIAHPVWQSGRGGNGHRGRDRDRDGDHDRDRSRSPYLGYGYGYPIYNTWAVMPWEMGYADVSGTDNSQNAAPNYNEPAQQEYAPPPQDEYRPPYREPQPDYAPPPPSAAPAAAISSTVLESEPALTLVFKDGHQQSIRNYALTSDAVIVLDKAAAGRQERIPLADLNLAATKQAAEAAGLDFAVPR